MAHGGTATGTSAPPLALGLRVNLSVMMFLQFAIWGAWFVVFYPYLKGKGFNDQQAGDLIGNVALGAILSTVFAGHIADRFFASERMMAVLHFVGAGLLYWMAQIQSPADYWLLFAVSLAYALLYNPTLALVNSIAFHHIPDSTRDFPGIRVLGTLGWIAVGFLIDFLFIRRETLPNGVVNVIPASASNGPLLLAAGLSALLGVYSLFLPHTPPTGKAGDTIPFLKALGLFKNPSFAVFFIVSFVITIVLSFYFTETSNFLEQAASVTHTGSTMLIGQVCELILLPFLPIFLWRLGMKWVLALGMFCWGLRYALFAYGGPEGLPFALVIAGVALHGCCFDFFFAAGFIYVDNEAPRDIRASGQALFGFLTYGLGMWLGNLVAGRLAGLLTSKVTPWEVVAVWGDLMAGQFDGLFQAVTVTVAGRMIQRIDWHLFWLVPSAGVLASLTIFLIFFHMRPRPTEPAGLTPEPWRLAGAPVTSDAYTAEKQAET
jgi:nucleoside transporter